MKIIFIVSSLSQPRCVKRIKSISEAGYDVEVYGFTRGFYDVNHLPSNIKVHNWGEIGNASNYLKRFRMIFPLVKNVVKSNKNNLFYSFGFDFSVVLRMLGVNYIYEISDILYANFNNSLLRNIFKSIDKNLIKKSKLTVLTSAGFYHYFYANKKCKNVITQPNMVSEYFKNYDRKPIKQKDKLVFSYVGALRYPNTVFRFADVIGKNFQNYEFHFYGNSSLAYLAEELSSKYENVKFFGEFKSPEDLDNIYNNIDIVVACYDTKTLNERIAEPNKLYEAICFCKPIIVSNNTFLSTRVKELQIGYSIDATVDQNIVNLIDGINKDDLLRFSTNEFNLQEKEYMYSPDCLLNKIKDIVTSISLKR